MLWEGRPLRDIRAEDVRAIVESRLEEHLQLEYKSELYADNDRARREFLLDVGMFANTSGGILLIGVPEVRDPEGQPTGVPDAGGILGLETPNPGTILNAYDARVMESIEERLSLESAPIEMGNGRSVIAIRVPNSTLKPHSVRHQGHIYFPARRERQRYHLSLREIKELVMRTSSRLEQAENSITNALETAPLLRDAPYLITGIVPVFAEDFLIDFRIPEVRQAIGNFNRAGNPWFVSPVYTFDGMERREGRLDHTALLRRSGLLRVGQQLPLIPGRQHQLGVRAIDILLRHFVHRASAVYQAAGIGGPFALSMLLRIQQPLVGVYADANGWEEDTDPIPPVDYQFPCLQIEDFSTGDKSIRPLCDQVHQMFGRAGSPSFNAAGDWIGSDR